jgi:hypothetical protein
MGTRARRRPAYHVCTCGESFETTDALVSHARRDHGLFVG